MRKAKNQSEAFKDEEWPDDKAFVQWKGTDVCMDFHCPCGHANHYDGFFAYEVICGGCKKVYAPNPLLEMVELEEFNEPLESNT